VIRLGRAWRRGLGPGRFQGIRFRLGAAMALALLPILVLSAYQTVDAFRLQGERDRQVLQQAAARSASEAKSRLDGASVLLQAVRPDALRSDCGERLRQMVERLNAFSALVRLDAAGRPTCSSRTEEPAAAWANERNAPWFARLRDGERQTVARAPTGAFATPSVIAAARLERPLGDFEGAMAAVMPLSELQPDTTDATLPPGAESALTDAAGHILVATDMEAFRTGGAEIAGWVERASSGPTVFEADAGDGRRVYAGAALAGRDVYVLLSAPRPAILSWARLNLFSTLVLPVGAWMLAFTAVMLLSERIVVRWLDYLERVASIYARGRFNVRPVQAVNAPSEIRLLARTLDELAETITTRDRSLLESLDEKDTLMREIHHRVKNNLQIISSLLSMQQRALKDEPAKAALGDTRQRIAALALIYRTLYQSENIRHADAAEFLNELVGQLLAADQGRGALLGSSVEADSLLVDPDKLAPLALWLVEAISNAQKHAFADGRRGEIQVRFKVQGDTSVLEVQDNGVGVNEATRAGVGRTLMGAFAKQLRGEAELLPLPEGGAVARMRFLTPIAVKSPVFDPGTAFQPSRSSGSPIPPRDRQPE